MSVLRSVRSEVSDSLAVLGLAAILRWVCPRLKRPVRAGPPRTGFDHRADGAFEFGQVVVDRRLQDRMSGVEVAVGQVIAHAGDLAPRDSRLGVEHFGGQGLDGLADFQQPDPDRVEDQAVGQIPSLQV
jgi:hypothetical protein